MQCAHDLGLRPVELLVAQVQVRQGHRVVEAGPAQNHNGARPPTDRGEIAVRQRECAFQGDAAGAAGEDDRPLDVFPMVGGRGDGHRHDLDDMSLVAQVADLVVIRPGGEFLHEPVRREGAVAVVDIHQAETEFGQFLGETLDESDAHAAQSVAGRRALETVSAAAARQNGHHGAIGGPGQILVVLPVNAEQLRVLPSPRRREFGGAQGQGIAGGPVGREIDDTVPGAAAPVLGGQVRSESGLVDAVPELRVRHRADPDVSADVFEKGSRPLRQVLIGGGNEEKTQAA